MSSDINRAKRQKRTIITYTILAVIVIALVLYVILRRQDRLQYQLPTIPAISAGEIDEITLTSPEGTVIQLQSKGGGWRIAPQGYKVDDELVSDMTEALANFRISDLVSTRSVYERYDLDDDAKLIILAGGEGKELLTFDAGKVAPSYNHTYVRLPDDDRVFHGVGDLRRTFDKSVSDLRDKLVLSFPAIGIESLVAIFPNREIRLVKSVEPSGTGEEAVNETVWRTPSGEIWEAEKIDELLNRIDDLRCSEYLTNESTKLGTPGLTLIVTGEREHTLSLFSVNEEGYEATSSGTPYPFRISTWQGESILDTFETDS